MVVLPLHVVEADVVARGGHRGVGEGDHLGQLPGAAWVLHAHAPRPAVGAPAQRPDVAPGVDERVADVVGREHLHHAVHDVPLGDAVEGEGHALAPEA